MHSNVGILNALVSAPLSEKGSPGVKYCALLPKYSRTGGRSGSTETQPACIASRLAMPWRFSHAAANVDP